MPVWLKQESKWKNRRRQIGEKRAPGEGYRIREEKEGWEAVVTAHRNIFAFVLSKMENHCSVLSRGVTASNYNITKSPWITLAVLRMNIRGQS